MVSSRFSDFNLESFFTGAISPLTYKTYCKNKTSKKIKKGEMGSSHVHLAPNTQSSLVRAMSNINLNQLLYD